MTTPASITAIGIVLLVIIVLFLIFREAILWYFKINKRVNDLELMRAYLMMIAKTTNPIDFKKFQDTIHDRPTKSTLKEDVEKIQNTHGS